MTQYDKLVQRILRGASDADISFSELRRLLMHLGFEERVRGSHHVFRKADVEARINLQESGAKAKPYQVRQVRKVLIENKMIRKT
jgi:predicted RNA binding protein YcfA (HicA-like mRNA interferase family)